MEHKTRTKALSWLLSLALMLGLLPTMVLTASAATSYNVWIGGVEVTSDNSSGTGWSYDSDSNTLTLNGYQNSGNSYKYENSGKYAAIYAKQDLTISLTGESTVTVNENSMWDDNHGVFVDGKLTIQGEGQVTVNGKTSGIRSKSLQIDSGTVNASCDGTFPDASIYITEDGNGLTINGGNVTASGKKGIKVGGGDVSITGGTVNAVGSGYQGYGISVDNGDVTISGGEVTAISTSTSNSVYRNGIIVDGSGKKLTIGASVTSVTLSGADGAVRGGVGSVVNAVAGIGWDNKEGTGTATDISISTSGQKLNYKKAQFPAPPAYMEATVDETTHEVTFSKKTCTDYTKVTSDTTTWSEGWYVVSGDVTIGNRITVSGTVNLILCDGAKLTASKGIQVSDGFSGYAIYSNQTTPDTGMVGTLNIYAQSGGTGELIVTGTEERNAGIGGGKIKSTSYPNNGTVSIYGGKVTVNSKGAGIGGGYDGSYQQGGNGGTITIYGGTIDATCVDGGYAGIGGGSNGSGGTITIYGGDVTARSAIQGAGIGGGYLGDGGVIVIHGGTVNASCGNLGAGIGGGIMGAGGNVTITGGNVTADGGTEAMGIGRGCDGIGNGSLTLGPGMYLYKDSVSQGNAVKKNDDGDYERSVKMIVNNTSPHTHNLTYSGSKTAVTATCNGNMLDFCDFPLIDGKPTATLTIAAPTQESNHAAVLTQNPVGSFTNLPAIQYQTKTSDGWGETSTTAPSGKGFHKASITLTNTDNSTAKAEVTYGLNTITTEADGDPDGCSFTVPEVAAVDAKIKPTFTLATGYEVKSITVKAGENDVTQDVHADTEGFTMPEYSVTVDVTFGKIDYDITISDADNGTVTAKKGDDAVTTANYGDKITLAVTPAENYGVKTVTANSGTLVQTALDPETGVATYELTMDANNATVTAEFAELTTYTVFYNASGSPSSVSVRLAVDTGNGYAMTNNAKFGDLDCWSTQIRAGVGIDSLSLSIKVGDADWASLNIPVVTDLTAPEQGAAVALAGETNAFVVAFVWGENTAAQSRYYLVTSNTGSVDVPNPDDTDSATFSGWTYLVPASEQGAEGEAVTVNKAVSGDSTTVQLDKIKQTTIVNAIWTPKSYTVSFNPDNGGATASETVTYGNKVNQPANPTKDGYEFVGWVLAKGAVEQVGDKTLQLSAGTTFDFTNTGIINNLELKAKWRHVHSYVCLQLDNAVFGDAFKDFYGYKGQLHIKLCTSMDDYTVEAHSFVNGKCACGASILDDKVTLTQYVGDTENAIKAIRNSFVSISAPQKSGSQTFSKWQYSFNATTKDDGSWADLTSARSIAFAIPNNMSTRAVYENETAKLSIRSFKYDNSHVAFQFDYSVPEGYTVVDGGLMWGDNIRMKFWDCTIKSFLGNQYEPSLRDAVSVFGGGTIASKMYNYQTINEPGLATPFEKPLKSFGRTGTVAVAWQPYTSDGYKNAIRAGAKVDGYNQRTYPTYAMGYIICKHNGAYVGFMTNAISATLERPSASHVAQISVSG